MTKKLLTLACLIFSLNAYAKSLECRTLVNNQVVMKEKVETALNQKVVVGKTSMVSVYVTEKPDNMFIVEGFLSSYEVRIYGQGFLRSKSDFLTSSLWGRESIVDITCRSK